MIVISKFGLIVVRTQQTVLFSKHTNSHTTLAPLPVFCICKSRLERKMAIGEMMFTEKNTFI